MIRERICRRLAWCSDIHLGFLQEPRLRVEFFKSIRSSGADGVIISGDVSIASRIGGDLDDMATFLGVPVWFCLGNHDWWGDSLAALHRRLETAIAGNPLLRWLPKAGVVALNRDVALVGVDNWADCPVEPGGRKPRDWYQISDFFELDTPARLDLSRYLAVEAAHALEKLLLRAAGHSRVIVACHIPPYFSDAPYLVSPGDVHLPEHFCSRATGDAIINVSRQFQSVCFTVLCGHIHVRCRRRVSDNIEVRIAAADYGRPQIEQIIETGSVSHANNK